MKQCFLKNNKFVGGLFSSLHSSLFFETGQCKSAPTYVNAFLQELTATVNSPQSSTLCVLRFKSVEEPRDSATLNEQVPLSGLSCKNECGFSMQCIHSVCLKQWLLIHVMFQQKQVLLCQRTLAMKWVFSYAKPPFTYISRRKHCS